MSTPVLAIVALLYLLVIGYLGFRGFKDTKSASDYLVAGRNVHPFIMALSYGATFISTSAIVGFGGAAAAFGMGLLWLTFLNIFVGIFIAFTLFGKRTRLMGHRLQAHTFPELLGKRFNSRFIQGFVAVIIVLFMPLYASAVLIGAARFIETTFQVDYHLAVAFFSLIIAGYVVAGGLKGVMYTDALQGTLMFIGMAILVVYTYTQLGGVTKAHQDLAKLPAQIETDFDEAVPRIRAIAPADVPDAELFGWFAGEVTALKSTATMTDDEKAAFMAENPDVAAVGGLMKSDLGPQLTNKLVLAKLGKGGFQGWTHMPKTGSNMFYVLVTSIILGVGIGVLAQPQLAVRFMTVKNDRELHRAILVGGVFILCMTGVAFIIGNVSNVWFMEHGGKVALGSVPDGNIDLIIPAFITGAMPGWFGGLFMLTLLSAAMSTLSSQFHAMGTSIGRDFYEQAMHGTEEHEGTVLVTRLGIILAILVTVVLAYALPNGIIAAATAIFFGLCAAAFLPAYIGGLYWKRMTRAGAIASICTGFGVSFFWLMFVQMIKGKMPAILTNLLFGETSLLSPPWCWIETIIIALPISTVVAIVVSLMTKPEPNDHLAHCFEGIEKQK